MPDQYTYFRTEPANIFGASLANSFRDRLSSWALETLGLPRLTGITLSLYSNGCGQGLHNDAENGQLACVYSLTRWDHRRFSGGETLILKPENYWQTERSERAGAGTEFLEMIPARFNQLLIFDDRLVHGVERVQGTMSPVEGRIVMHCHLRYKLHVAGDLSLGEVAGVLRTLTAETKSRLTERVRTLRGFATARLTVAANGSVSGVSVLLNRLTDLMDEERAHETLQMILDSFEMLRFPSKSVPSQITVPIVTR